MAGRRRAAAVVLMTAGLVAAWASPAFAPYSRQAANAVNITETCPNYLSLEVARQVAPEDIRPQNVTILAYALPASGQRPGTLVLNQAVRLRPVDPFLRPLANEPESDFQLHGRAVLRWDTGRLAPGTKLLVGPPEDFEDPPQELPIEVTVSARCDPPNLRLSSSCSTTGGPHTWRVRNPEALAVDFNAEVLFTRPARVILGTVPPNNGVAEFTTQVAGPDVVVLFVGGIPVDAGVCLR
jgi:hypothetical protein